jgi:hypothetical protein
MVSIGQSGAPCEKTAGVVAVRNLSGMDGESNGISMLRPARVRRQVDGDVGDRQ